MCVEILSVNRGWSALMRNNCVEKKGVEILLRDARGRIQGRYMDGKYDKTPVPGKNLKLGIDVELQMLGERLLEGKIGRIVLSNPKQERYYVWYLHLLSTLG